MHDPALHLASRNLPANGENTLNPRRVSRVAARMIDDAGVQVHQAALRRLADSYVRAGHTDLDALPALVAEYVDATRRFSLGYADPTGSQAVANVMRGGRR